jgi:UDP-N-acetylmuramoylalanine--D-glutamate ligase
MTGARIAIFGLGRSGVSAAKLALKMGAIPTICDEKPADQFVGDPLLEDSKSLEIHTQFGFEGEWSASETDLIVTSPGVPKNHQKLLNAVRNGIQVISEIELAYRASRAPIIAITGTNGKSTTTVMTYLCLKAAGVDAVLCGNIYGSGYHEIALTEAAMDSKPDQVLVAEISSFQLEWIDKFQPMAAIITNLSDDHLNRYADFAEYVATKRRVFENMAEGDSAVWNNAFPNCEPPKGKGILTYDLGTEKGDAFFLDEQKLLVRGEPIELSDLPFGGKHNYENAMAAMLLAATFFDFEFDTAKLVPGLKAFRGLSHRMEHIGSKQGVLLINNSMCTNPAAIVASSQSLSRRQHLLVGGVDKGMDFAPVREYLEVSNHEVYLFGTDAMTIRRQLGDNLPVFLTMAEAFEFAITRAKDGEIVMLAPGAASMDQFSDFRDRGEQFTKMAKEWLEECETV